MKWEMKPGELFQVQDDWDIMWYTTGSPAALAHGCIVMVISEYDVVSMSYKVLCCDGIMYLTGATLGGMRKL